MARKFLISRVAFAVALAGGLSMALPTVAAAKEATPKISFSKEFSAAAADLDKAVTEAAKNEAVVAASQKAGAAKSAPEREAAQAEVDAALGGAKARLAAAAEAASTTGDKLKLGELQRNVGVYMADAKLQNQGLVTMLESGALPEAQLGQVNFLAGVTAYQVADYATAAKYLQVASDKGYKDKDGLLDRVLVDAYKRTNNHAAAAALVDKQLNEARASGAVPSETILRSAIQEAYDAKNLTRTANLSAELAAAYPTKESWNTAVTVVRALGGFAPQENLDLMRLMSRAGAMQDKRDYLEYIENADPRRLPGEVLSVISAGSGAGLLSASDISEYQKIASDRAAADRASLDKLEADARKANANAATVSGAGDVFLNYNEPAKAEEFYKLALSKPGIDQGRVLTRLGIAQADQGKFDDAKATFAKVTDARKPIAALWAAYAQSKTKGSPVS